jgi:hypothetical protein
MKAQREIHTGYDVHKTLPDTRRFYAECDDEATSIIVMNTAVLGDLVPADEDAFLASDWPARLLAEHLEQCEACAKWRAS